MNIRLKFLGTRGVLWFSVPFLLLFLWLALLLGVGRLLEVMWTPLLFTAIMIALAFLVGRYTFPKVYRVSRSRFLAKPRHRLRNRFLRRALRPQAFTFRWDEVKEIRLKTVFGIPLLQLFTVFLDRPGTSFWSGKGLPNKYRVPMTLETASELARCFVHRVGEQRVSPSVAALADEDFGPRNRARAVAVVFWVLELACLGAIWLVLHELSIVECVGLVPALLVVSLMGMLLSTVKLFSIASDFRLGLSFWHMATAGLLGSYLAPFCWAAYLFFGEPFLIYLLLVPVTASALAALAALLLRLERKRAWAVAAACLAFVSLGAYVREATLKRAIELGDLSGVSLSSPWTPDGEALLLPGRAPGGGLAAAWFSAEGERVREVKLPGDALHIRTVGRGGGLAQTGTTGEGSKVVRLWWVPRGAGRPKELLTNSHWSERGAMSPDGKRWCEYSPKHGWYVVDLCEGSLRKVLPDVNEKMNSRLRFDLQGRLRLCAGRFERDLHDADKGKGEPTPFAVWRLDDNGVKKEKLFEAKWLWRSLWVSPHMRFLLVERRPAGGSAATEHVSIDLDAKPPAARPVSGEHGGFGRLWGPRDQFYLVIDDWRTRRRQSIMKVFPATGTTEVVWRHSRLRAALSVSRDARYVAVSPWTGPATSIYRVADGKRVAKCQTPGYALHIQSYWSPQARRLYLQRFRHLVATQTPPKVADETIAFSAILIPFEDHPD